MHRLLARPRVSRLLAGAWDRRLTLVVAGSGYGKTTALETLAPRGWVAIEPTDRNVTQLAAKFRASLGLATPTAAAPAVGALDRTALADELAVDFCARVAEIDECLLVVDDAGQLGGDEVGPAWQFIRTVCRQAPPQLHLVVSGRRVPDQALSRAADGNVLRIGAEDLSFGAEELEELLAEPATARGESAAELAAAGLTATAGWPAAGMLLRDALGRPAGEGDQATLRELIEVDDAPWRPIARAFLADEPPEKVQVLRLAAAIGPIDADVVTACLDPSRAADLPGLVDRGAMVAARPRGFVALSPTLRGVVEIDPVEAGGWLRAACALFAASGHWARALDCARQLDDATVRDLLASTGRSMIAAGEASLVVAGLTAGSAIDADAVTLCLLGEAQQASGDWTGAIGSYRAAVRAGSGRLPASAAWRFAALLYMYGEPEAALESLLTADAAVGPADGAQVLAWKASAYWAKGEIGAATECAEQAVPLAQAARDQAALAAAHGVRALVRLAEGDWSAARHQLSQALTAAEAAGDGVQVARIRSNLCALFAETGEIEAATREADAAVDAARPYGGVVAGLVLGNRSDLMLIQGRVDDARASAAEAIEHYQLSNWRAAGAALLALSGADYQRGDLAKARVGATRAIELCDQIDDSHTGAAARVALALALAPDDADAAVEHAQAAIELSIGWNRAFAQYALALAAVATGALPAARVALAEAMASSVQNDDLRTLARVFELDAVIAEPPDLDRLGAAADQWAASGDLVGAMRCRLVTARVAGDAAAEAEAWTDLRECGLAADVGLAALLPRLLGASDRAPGATDGTEIRTLGSFGIARAGVIVPSSEWQSRKARDLVKLLVARQGQPTTRDQVAEVLWPDDSGSEGVSNRLSVLLTTIRRILDPERTQAADHFLTATDNGLALRVDRLSVDVQTFLGEVRRARELLASGGVGDEAEQLLLTAQARYHGDFLEEDVYADWSVDLREQARDAMLWTHRQLAAVAGGRGDHEATLAQLRRLLERDPYDEAAWLDLIRALRALRRLGEARRQHARYCQLMDELDAPAVPYASVSDAP